MPKSTYLDNTVLNAALRNTPYTSPATVYLALFTAAPNAGGGGTEVSGGAYVRQPITWTAPVAGSCSNSSDVSFPIATADWGTIVAFAVFDQASGGNMLYFANLSASRVILTNDQARFPTGQLITAET